MQTYRVRRLSAQGSIMAVSELECRDDAGAIAEAQLIENEHGLELWGGTRLIRVFPPLNLTAAAADRDRAA